MLSLNLVLLVSLIAGGGTSHAAKLTKNQIESIQTNMQNSKDMSEKSAQLQGKAQENSDIASSNFGKSNLQGFNQAATTFSNAKLKFTDAHKQFDDAWVAMEYALEHDEPAAAKEGLRIHNSAAQRFNNGVQLLNSAGETFKQAIEESKRKPAGAPQAVTTTGNQPAPAKPPWYRSALPTGENQKTFPVVAVGILIGTLITSLQAFKNRNIYDKYILHPWSITNQKTRYYTLLSCGLIHANPMHLTMNLMTFCFFGLTLEPIIGHVKFVLVYVGSLLFSSLVLTARHGKDAYYYALGASGAITGVIFSYILYRPNSKISFMYAPMGLPAPLFALFYIAFSYFMAKNKMDNVAHDAHLWGAIAGAVITVVVDPNVAGMVSGLL